MTEVIRFGDISGYDDAEVVPIDEELVVDFSDERSNDNENNKQDL